MPMERSSLSPLRHQEWDDAIREYRVSGNVVNTAEKRICPECNTRKLEPHKQLCYVCRSNRRKATFRNSGVRSTTEVEKSALESQAVT